MPLTRRGFLAVTGLTIMSRRLQAQTAADGFTLITARKVTLGLLENGAGKTAAFSFGDDAAPAVIRARQGQEIKLRFVNELDAEIWLHFFGLRGPSELMTINVPPGSVTTDVVFTPPDAGTFWVGPVSDASRLRDMGLSAMFIVEEAADVPGLSDVPLILDDWKLDEGGAISDGFGDVETMVGEGRLGNWFTVNNRFRPKLPLKPGVFTRLRILNAANVRVMGLQFKGHDPLLIALDGQPVKPRPLGAASLTLAPGQRADLLVTAAEGDITLALDLFEDVVELAYLTRDGDGAMPEIGDNFTLPPNPVAMPDPAAVPKDVALAIEGGIKGGLQSARFRDQTLDLRQLLEAGKGWALNGVAGPAAAPLFVARRGEVIALEADNQTIFSQPIHIHGHVWQLPAKEGEAGMFSDTAVVPSGERRRLVFVADNPGTWALQSLIAERADGGLIGAFEVQEDGPEAAPDDGL